MNRNSNKRNRSRAAASRPEESGFTRTDLAAVIVVIGLLGLLLLPALASDRSMSDGYRCMNNLRQLATAWLMYSGDNSDKICTSAGISSMVTYPDDPSAKPGGAKAQWVLGYAASLPYSTNADFIRNGLLFDYVRNLDAYKCPADFQTVGGYPTLRSVSMNAWMNPINTEGLLDESRYTVFRRQSDIKKPAATWLLVDENPNSINDGWFFETPSNPTVWYDIPAAYHRGAAGIAFTDTHVEMKRWTDRTVLSLAISHTRKDALSDDLPWLLERTTYPR